jgi:hypothetical protein
MRSRDLHTVPWCTDTSYTYSSPSGRIEIDVCDSCGCRVRADGRIVARGHSITSSGMRRDLLDAARGVPATAAAELRALAAL